jgi:esterase/lipase superfamily enzyme
MGNRLLTEAFATLAKPVAGEAHVRQVVFAAPDVDAATFKEAAHAFGGKAERFTLYASSRDKALAASKAVHKYSRAGDAGVDIVVVDTVDTIDASAVDTSLLGHSYYGDNARS